MLFTLKRAILESRLFRCQWCKDGDPYFCSCNSSELREPWNFVYQKTRPARLELRWRFIKAKWKIKTKLFGVGWLMKELESEKRKRPW